MTSAPLFKDTLLHRWEALDKSWRFAITAFLLMRLFYVLWSWAILTLQPLAIQNTELSGQPVLTVFKLQSSQSYTYFREVNGQVLTFQATNADVVIDSQTGSLWDISTGTAIQGQYKGSVLSPAKTPPSEIFFYSKAKPYPIE